MPRRKTKKKLPWTGFEITRVKLDPEQAVLSCCDAVSRGGHDIYGYNWQCLFGCYQVSTHHSTSS